MKTKTEQEKQIEADHIHALWEKRMMEERPEDIYDIVWKIEGAK